MIALGDGRGVGVVEHEHRRLAAELEVDALERVGRGAGDDLAGLDVAGERDHADVLVLDERLADRHAVAGDDVQHARREHVLRELRRSAAVVSGVCSAGFSTWTFPAASAGASFQIAIMSG